MPKETPPLPALQNKGDETMNRTTPSRMPTASHKRNAKNIFMKIAAGILIVLSMLMVLLVEAFTFMRLPARMIVGAAAVLFLFILWRYQSKPSAANAALAGLILLGPAAIWLSQILAYTPPILDSQGKQLAGSIAVMEAIQVNGVEEWLVIRGKNEHNPVLLYLSGGPGTSELGLVRGFDPALEEQFVVVVWEQPGTGKSYSARPYSTLTVDQYVSDGLAVTQYLRQRFQQDKIYLMGSSWGTILGVWMAQQQPGWFAAYIGMGQMVNTTENDIMSYNYALDYAQQKGDTEAVAAISKYGPPPYSGQGAALKYSNYLTSYVNVYDAENAGQKMPADFFQRIFLMPEYGLVDEINQLRGAMDGMDHVYAPQLRNLDLEAQAQKLDVPVYLMLGRFDHNANAILAERWFNRLQAPRKDLIWFEHSSHAPMIFETEKFNQVLAEKVLAKTAIHQQ
jgi:pimeloyl-ACP methyl ester carboxylesterase